MNRTLVIWGAGRIGRGFVADIFDSPLFHTVFVDADANLVRLLNERGRYTIARATVDGVLERTLENGFEAAHTSEGEKLRAYFEAPGLLLDIAVHAPKLAEVADMLAPLIAHRAGVCPRECMDILMNVNMPGPDGAFCALMRERLSGGALVYFNQNVGVTGIFAMCISPIAPPALLARDPLALWNNGFAYQAIDRGRLKCPPPALARLKLIDDVAREETRKLYTLNMAHAFLCYTGLPLGLTTAREAATDARLRPRFFAALSEAGRGLSGEYGFARDEMRAWDKGIVRLLENPYIEDGLQRLGADTRRKLGAWDRLAGPARLCMRHGRAPEALCEAIRAGFFYENEDEGTREVRAYVRARGLRAAVTAYCGFPEGEPLLEMIAGA